MIADSKSCPACPPRVVCSPCPPTPWYLADANDPRATRVRISEQPPPLTSGARYRLRVQPNPSSPVKDGVRVVTVFGRLAKAPGASDDVCDECLSHRVEWGQAAGLGPTVVYAVEPRRGFSVRQVGRARAGGRSAQMPCSPRLADKIETVLGYSDVNAALARAPVVFGRDVRPSDQAIPRIAVDGKELFVGLRGRARVRTPASGRGAARVRADARARGDRRRRLRIALSHRPNG